MKGDAVSKTTYSALRIFAGPIIKRMFSYEYDTLDHIKGPYILLSNHNMDVDPAFLGLASKEFVYFVATENITRMGLPMRTLAKLLRPIIHRKGKSGSRTVIEMLRYLKSGENIAMFPEGNRSYAGVTCEIVPSTGRVAKKSGATLITYRLEGGYLKQPRWGRGIRKGNLRGRLVNVYTPDALKGMSDDEIEQAIRTDLYEDAFETQAKHGDTYTGKNLAEGMERVFTVCPVCKGVGTLHTHDDKLFCDCGYSAVYGTDGRLRSEDGLAVTPAELDKLQKEVLAEKVKASKETGEMIFSDDVSISTIGADHTETHLADTQIAAYGDKFTAGERVISPDELSAVSVFSRNTLTAFIDDMQYEIHGGESFNALRYVYVLEFMKKDL